jgi:hypothetical protein
VPDSPRGLASALGHHMCRPMSKVSEVTSTDLSQAKKSEAGSQRIFCAGPAQSRVSCSGGAEARGSASATAAGTRPGPGACRAAGERRP